jgi:hypothetical protein
MTPKVTGSAPVSRGCRPVPPRGQVRILLRQIAGSYLQCGREGVYVVRHTMIMDTLASTPQAPLGISHLVRVPGAPAASAWRPAPREGPRSPLGGRRGGGTALLATYSAARPGSPDTGWIAAAASRSAAARIAAIWLLACCRTSAAARSAASCMALTSAHAQCLMLAAWPSARLRIRHACQSEPVSRNRPGCCGYLASCE